jgi:predicted transcriptional regulator
MIEPDDLLNLEMAARVSLSATIKPELKEALQKLAERDRRSMSQMLEILIERAALDAGVYSPSSGEDSGN